LLILSQIYHILFHQIDQKPKEESVERWEERKKSLHWKSYVMNCLE